MNMSSREAGNEVRNEDSKRADVMVFTLVCVCCLSLLTDDTKFGGTVNDFVSFSKKTV